MKKLLRFWKKRNLQPEHCLPQAGFLMENHMHALHVETRDNQQWIEQTQAKEVSEVVCQYHSQASEDIHESIHLYQSGQEVRIFLRVSGEENLLCLLNIEDLEIMILSGMSLVWYDLQLDEVTLKALKILEARAQNHYLAC